MTIEEIKQDILQIFRESYKYNYTGKLIVNRLSPIGLEVILGMNNIDKPIRISAELQDQDFLKFFKKEIQSRDLSSIKFFLGVKTYPDTYKC